MVPIMYGSKVALPCCDSAPVSLYTGHVTSAHEAEREAIDMEVISSGKSCIFLYW